MWSSTRNVLTAGRKRYRLDNFRNIYVIGAGKASAEMAQAIERLLGKRIAGGLINIKYGHAARLRRIELNECGHPIPDRNGELGAQRIAEIARQAGPNDLVLCLISGALPLCCRCPLRRSLWRRSRRPPGCCSTAARISTS